MILQMVLQVFKTESAVVSLVDGHQGYCCNGAGAVKEFSGGTLPWLTTICGFTLNPQQHEVLVVEDLHAEAR